MLWTKDDQFACLKRGFFIEPTPEDCTIHLRLARTMDELERQVLKINLARDGFTGDDPFAVKLADFIATPHNQRKFETGALNYNRMVHAHEKRKAEREYALYKREQRKKMSPEDRARAQTKDKLIKHLDALSEKIDRTRTSRYSEQAICDAAFEQVRLLTATLGDLERQRDKVKAKLAETKQ